MARQFAGSGTDAPVHWVQGTAAPRLAGALARLECRPWREYDGGDHTLFVGEVTDYDYRDGSALGFHMSGFTMIAEEEFGIESLL